MAEVVVGLHPYASDRSLIVGEHGCYFCRPTLYPPMPRDHSLCACCGALIYQPGITPLNEEMVLCDRCDEEIAAQFRKEYGDATDPDDQA